MSKSKEDTVRRIIGESGNSFHAKVLKFFQDHDWTVQISPFYSDAITGKAREIDLIAEKPFPAIKDTWGRTKGTLRVRLYIECKFVKQETVFWFYQQDMAATIEWLESHTPLRKDNVFIRDHHYLSSSDKSVAKLFSGPNVNAAEGEQIYKALSQGLNATVVLRLGKSIIPDVDDLKPGPTIHYPLIVCNSFNDFFRTEIETENEAHELTDNFLLEVNYAWLNRAGVNVSEFFLIDVVSFDKLELFLRAINKDVEAMQVLLSD